MRRRYRFSKEDLELLLIALPTVVWYILFCYLPMFGIIIAFKQFRPLPDAGFIMSLIKSEFVGFDNFKFLFATPDAWIIFRNTLAYNAVFIVLDIVIPVALAIMISQLHSQKLAKVCQTAMFLPHFLSWVVVSYFVFAFLSVDKGLLNQLYKALGWESVEWYMQPRYWPYILTFLHLWKGMGYGMVVYLASISGIDISLYEAALIDGSTKWQQVKYITLPMLKPIITIMFILSIGHIFTTDFGLFYNIPRNSGPLINVTQTIDVYVYKALMGMNNIGFSSAAAFLQSIFGFITITTANWIVRKIDPNSSLF
ncbi:ABC transporter permease subunit [Caldicoprobacter algeriensis]|uniref:ABC transporter permease n=1 Tax=Caldicoprobacter algeriensis TaxID=699281 RepID=UPI002079DB6C|nr:ABC transporter permease subunit [Caldicoprobacter algeriensis]MCM8900694.1 ABC transporter permease subunit [Caldicoprobacter algeriensis]